MIFGENISKESVPTVVNDRIFLEHLTTINNVRAQLGFQIEDLRNTGIVIPGGGGSIIDGLFSRRILIIDQTPFFAFRSNRILKGWQEAIEWANYFQYQHDIYSNSEDVSPAVQIAQQLNLLGIPLQEPYVMYRQENNKFILTIDDGGEEPVIFTYFHTVINSGRQLNQIAINVMENKSFGLVAKAFLYGGEIVRQALQDNNSPEYFVVDGTLGIYGNSLETIYGKTYQVGTYYDELAAWGYQNDIETNRGNKIFFGVKSNAF